MSEVIQELTVIEATIEPIIVATYGDSGMSRALAHHLSLQIDSYVGEDREHMILHACWNWFSGGDTAASVAAKIEAALEAPDDCHEPSAS